MVNYKRVVCEVAVLAVLATVTTAAPAHDCKEAHYDQRQNGTENIRLNIDGVVIAVAPAESFLAAASHIDIGDLFEVYNEIQKPNASDESSPLKPDGSKPDVPNPQDPKPETPLNDVSLDVIRPETKGQKKEAVRKQVKGQRLKTMLANMLVPLLRRSHTHEN